MNIKILLGILVALSTEPDAFLHAQAIADAPRLEILNNSDQVIDLFWLKSDTERVAMGSVAAGKSTSIKTTLGHRFEIIGRTDKASAKVTCESKIQEFRYPPIANSSVTNSYSVDDMGLYVNQNISGWNINIRRELLDSVSAKTDTELAMKLLAVQLDEIIRVVPANAVAELKKVPLWFSPNYPATPPRAEYHPNVGWLRDNHRNPAMVKGIEFTNIKIFEAETRRMPNFALHELAHAYHDRVLPQGFDNPDLKAAYEAAKKSGKYDRVERQDSEGRKSMDRAYAMTNPQEYFAESTEAYFTRNDFFPYDQKELMEHDPATVRLISDLWGTP